MFKEKHRRAQSDITEPSGVAKCRIERIEPLPDLNEDSRSNSSSRDSLSEKQQKRISFPRAADAGKMQEFSAQKISTIQHMQDQVSKECEELRMQFDKKPTEMNYTNLESKIKVLRRLQSQISQHTPDSEVSTPLTAIPASSYPPGNHHPLLSGRSSSVGTKDKPIVLLSQINRGKVQEVESPNATKASYLERVRSSLGRSHSDRSNKPFTILSKNTGERLRQAASSNEIFMMSDSRETLHSRNMSSSRDIHSDVSSDTTNEPWSPPCFQSGLSNNFFVDSNAATNRLMAPQRDIIAFDDLEFLSDNEDIPLQNDPFNDFSVLKKHSAHLSVFLHYLISNSDPSPLLFNLVTDMFYGSGRDTMYRWAYEIYVCFLAEKAPLKVCINEMVVNSLGTVLQSKHDKEDLMKTLVRAAAVDTEGTINELLHDFGVKRQLGLGSLYGDHELKESMDRVSELKVVENSLWKHFERLVQDERNERSLVMASALATFFRRVGYFSSSKTASLQEKCTTFNYKDKNKFSAVFGKTNKQKMIIHCGHQFQSELYFAETSCQLCKSLLCSVGNSGYQCHKCDQNFHKVCLEAIKEPCSGKKSRSASLNHKKSVPKSKSSLFGKEILPGMDRSREHSIFFLPTSVQNKAVLIEEPEAASASKVDQIPEQKHSSTNLNVDTSSLRRNPSSEKLFSDQHHLQSQTENLKSPLNSTTSQYHFISNSSTIQKEVVPCYADSDLDCETTLPQLETFISRDVLKKMKPKEKKRQHVINEFLFTEKTHVRNLKVMFNVFYVPMKKEHSSELVNLLFPNIKDLVELHASLNKDFKQLKQKSDSGVTGEFLDIMTKHFSGKEGLRFKEICARFCQKQSHALERLKAKQRRDQKLASFIQEASNNPLCRRLELKDILPTEMQRLTKYPLLIENLIKYTPQTDVDEYGKLQLAYYSTQDIASHVDRTVHDFESHLKLVELQKKLEKRLVPVENSNSPYVGLYKDLDLTKHRLVFDGPLVWRITSQKSIYLHVVLLEDALVLLQKQDDKLVLRFQSTLITAGKEDTRYTHSPIMRVSEVLVKSVANEKCAFFLVSTSDLGPQIYSLVATSKDEKNMWCNNIMAAATGAKASAAKESASHPIDSLKRNPSTNSDSTVNIEVEKSISGPSSPVTEVPAESSCVESVQSMNLSEEPIRPIENIQRINDLINEILYEKEKLLSELYSATLNEEEYKFSGFFDNLCCLNTDSDPNSIVLTLLHDVNRLLDAVNEFQKCHESRQSSVLPDDSSVEQEGINQDLIHSKRSQPFLSSIQLINLSRNLHQQLLQLLEFIVKENNSKKTDSDENIKVQITTSQSNDSLIETKELDLNSSSEILNEVGKSDSKPLPIHAGKRLLFESPATYNIVSKEVLYMVEQLLTAIASDFERF